MKKNKLNFFCLIEARLNSKRLPGKVLKKIYHNFNALDYVISNILSAGIDKDYIILNTTKKKIDIKIQTYVKKKYKIKIFKGDERNVFNRVYSCCKKFEIKSFARFTSDNILLDPILIRSAIDYFNKKKIDYLSTRSMDHTDSWKEKSDYNEGSSIEILKASLLKKVAKNVTKLNYEYPTWNIFSNPSKFKLTKFKLISKYKGYNLKKIRTTLDTKKDFNFLKNLCKSNNLIPGNNNLIFLLKNYKKNPNKLYNYNNKKKIAYKIIQKRSKKS